MIWECAANTQKTHYGRLHTSLSDNTVNPFISKGRVQSKDIKEKTQAFEKEMICYATEKLQSLTNYNLAAPELNLLMP